MLFGLVSFNGFLEFGECSRAAIGKRNLISEATKSEKNVNFEFALEECGNQSACYA